MFGNTLGSLDLPAQVLSPQISGRQSMDRVYLNKLYPSLSGINLGYSFVYISSTLDTPNKNLALLVFFRNRKSLGHLPNYQDIQQRSNLDSICSSGGVAETYCSGGEMRFPYFNDQSLQPIADYSKRHGHNKDLKVVRGPIGEPDYMKTISALHLRRNIPSPP